MPNQQTRDLTRPLASAALALFASACSGETINLGENTSTLEAPEPSCPASGTVVARNQADIDALAGCEALDGLIVVPFAGADLRPLSSLREVAGVFELGLPLADGEDASELFELFALLDERWLFSLEGLERLERVGQLAINGFSVESLEPLSNLRALTGNGGIQLVSCDGIRDLAGLENVVGLRTIDVDCTELESLSGLAFPDAMDDVFLSAPALRDLGQLDSTSVRSLIINTTGLETLDGLATLQTAETIGINTNRALRNIDGLDNLLAVGLLSIEDNAALERLPELASVFRLDELIVRGNPRLQNIPTFAGILADFNGFSELFELGRRDLLLFRLDGLDIQNNPALEQLVLPPGLQSAGLVTIENNTSLRDIAFSDVTSIDFLSIANNTSLESVALGDLARVDDLEVSGNPALGLDVFDALQTFSSAVSAEPAEAP